MKQQIISDVVQHMLPHLDNAQVKELQKVLEYTLFGCEITKQEEKKTANDNPKLVDDFVAAKRIEGCSEKDFEVLPHHDRGNGELRLLRTSATYRQRIYALI